VIVRVPRVYLGWANPVFLPFFPFNRINNLRIFSVAFSPIPTAPANAALADQWRCYGERRPAESSGMRKAHTAESSGYKDAYRARGSEKQGDALKGAPTCDEKRGG
jgi:hypothetical protein